MDKGAAARSRFPRGLLQPEGFFRFSVDSLLVAAFAWRAINGKHHTVADLGAGCGVIGLAMALAFMEDDTTSHNSVSRWSITTFEQNLKLVEATRHNAILLGVDDKFTTFHADVRTLEKSFENLSETFSIVVCNPPYRLSGRGREPRGPRRSALFDVTSSIEDFAESASFLLNEKGRAFFVYGASEIDNLFRALHSARLTPKRLRAVHGHMDSPAKIFLLEARKNGGPGLCWEPPLVLYQGGIVCEKAIRFCPWLSCNSRRIL